MKIGTSLNFAQSSREGCLDLKESLSLIKDAGFDAIEIDLSRGIGAAALPIAYAGIMSCGVAYTFQIIGQKHTHPTVASIIMSLEGVFAVLGGALMLAQMPTTYEFIGCALMLAASVISQLGNTGGRARRGAQ